MESTELFQVDVGILFHTVEFRPFNSALFQISGFPGAYTSLTNEPHRFSLGFKSRLRTDHTTGSTWKYF